MHNTKYWGRELQVAMRGQQLAELGSMAVEMEQRWSWDEYCEVCELTEDTIQRVAE